VKTPAYLLLLLGLFLIGGVISLVRQGLPKAVSALLGVSAVLALTAGVLWL
jgi:hypothetical protein